MNDYIKISKYAGMREDLVQAGGGNSSYKVSPEKMLIKASGYQLADVSDKTGYAVVNPRIIQDAFLSSKDLNSMTELDSKQILNEAFLEGERPSIETFLHAVSGKYTLHTHPIAVNALTCRSDGMELLETMFPEAMVVSYATPGIELAKAYFNQYKLDRERKKCDVVFLQNHGLVVSGNSADDVISKTEEVTLKIEKYLGSGFDEYHDLTALWKHFSKKILWKVTDENVMNFYREQGIWNHAFCPDCVVFLGKRILILSENYNESDINDFIERYGAPVVVGYKGFLYLIADSVKKAFEIQSVLSFSAQVMRLNQDKECVILSDSEQNFLLNWDAEKYRKNIK